MTGSTRCPMCDSARVRVRFQKIFRDKPYSLACCSDCDQNFCVPQLSADEIATFYEGDYHTGLRSEDGTDKRFGAKFARYRDWILEFVKGGRSLDIGTATGLFPSLLKQAGFEAEGLELNQESAQWGESHYGVKIWTCRLERIDRDRASYDLISMTDVLEHMENPLHFLGRVREYLKPGGFVLVTFPDISSLESRYTRLLAYVLKREWIWYCCHIPYHTWEFTPPTACAMFEKAGFSAAGFRRCHEHPEYPPDAALQLLFSPVRILDVPALSSRFGTRMEFMLQRGI